MSLKQFKFAKIVTAVLVALIVAQNVVNDEFFIPIVVVALASLVLFYLKSRVKEVVVDERDYAIAGKAALLTVQIFGWLAMVTVFIFYSQQEKNSAFAPVAVTLAYATCALLLLYTLIFHFYDRNSAKYEK